MREPFWWRDGVAAGITRLALSPLSVAWWGASTLRNLAFDLGVLRATRTGVPVISVGNVTVGGTGKTPVASWLAGRLLARGVRPGIVLRGYGGDETLVHQELQPDAAVVANSDRIAGIAAARNAGASVVILDDAMQHRRVHRDVDVALVSADVPWAHWTLPGGPLRESWAAGFRRADLVVVTAKASSAAEVADAVAASRRRGARRVAAVRLAADQLRAGVGGGVRALADVRGSRILAVSGIANPAPFLRTLTDAGAVVDPATFGDHHRFGAADVDRLLARARGVDFVVCTLKDAVKLRQSWPQSGPGLWYVSQRVEPIEGASEIEAALDRVCSRPDTSST